MKLFITIIFSFFIVSTSSAQTKDETIKWLRDKLENYIEAEPNKLSNGDYTFYDIKLESINECEIVFIRSTKYNENSGWGRITRITLPTQIS